MNNEDREIIIRLAEKVMGLEVRVSSNTGNTIAVDKSDTVNRVHLFGKFPNLRVWNPLESIADAFEVQAGILARGIDTRRRYTCALNRIAWDQSPSGHGRDWAMVSATPRQRCLAAVEATHE